MHRFNVWYFIIICFFFFNRLLTSGVLFSDAFNETVVAKAVMLGILSSISVIL